MLNIVVPMAGRGSRFADAGYLQPKPLIPVHGVPMIKVVIDNLTPKISHRFIFICQNSHIQEYSLLNLLPKFAPGCEIIGIDGITEGQLCTVLKAETLINNDDPVMTANSDQFIDFSIDKYLDRMTEQDLDGMIMTMKSNDPKWSYAKTNQEGLVIETAEKKVISNHATVGIFNFKRGQDLVSSAKLLIANNERVNGEFYTCPVYNYMIQNGSKVGIFDIGEEYNGMYGLGIPKDLEFFLNHPVSKQISRD